MKFSYNWLKEILNFDFSPKEIRDLLTLYAFEVDGLREFKDDYILDIDILPNRASDAQGHYGLARELQAILNFTKRVDVSLKEPLFEVPGKSADKIAMVVKEPSLAPCYFGAIIGNLKIKPSPRWIQERLEACGIAPINNIVDITNYIMLELGQPLHAFDFDKIKGEKIIVRRAKKGEKIDLIGGEDKILSQDILVIVDQEGPLALAGIKGGRRAEITENTRTIFLEAAHFNKENIYQNTKNLKIDSEAAKLFSSGIDEKLPLSALKRALYLIRQDVSTSKLIAWKEISCFKEKSHKIALDYEKLKILIGAPIPYLSVKKILILLGCQVSERKEKKIFLVTIPNFRKDLLIEEDLIEEVARLTGYLNLPSICPKSMLAPVFSPEEEIYEKKLKDVLKSVGFFEVYNYSFEGEAFLEKIGTNKTKLVFLKNPVSQRLNILRPSLLPNLFLNLEDNLKYEEELRLFEVGNVFQQQKDIEEIKELGMAITDSSRRDAFFELKGVIDLFLKSLGITDFWYDEIDAKDELFEKLWLPPEHLAEIKIGDEKIGIIGEVSPALLLDWDIKQNVVASRINLDKLFRFVIEEEEYQPPSKYPAATRDIALLIDKSTKISQILNIIEDAKIAIVKDVDLFDIYEEADLKTNQKSLAFHIIYQSDDHTLTDEEVNKAHQKIEEALKKGLGATIR